jgi:hypothetical protein
MFVELKPNTINCTKPKFCLSFTIEIAVISQIMIYSPERVYSLMS